MANITELRQALIEKQNENDDQKVIMEELESQLTLLLDDHTKLQQESSNSQTRITSMMNDQNMLSQDHQNVIHQLSNKNESLKR